MKRIRIVGLCLVAVFALSAAVASSASAGSLLYVSPGGFPVHYHGLVTTTTKLETVGNKNVECTGGVHILGDIISVHLSITDYLFLGCKGPLGTTCTSTGEPAGAILALIHEHLGLIDDPSGNLFNDPGVLGLVSNIHFICKLSFIEEEVNVEGSLIGQIISPAVGGEASSTAELLYANNGTTGQPLFTLFLSPLLGTVHSLLLTKVGSGGSKEVSSQTGRGSILYTGGRKVGLEVH